MSDREQEALDAIEARATVWREIRDAAQRIMVLERKAMGGQSPTWHVSSRRRQCLDLVHACDDVLDALDVERELVRQGVV